MSKRVLVTGGSGFIGRRLCQELLDSGYIVRSLDSLVEQVHGGQAPHNPGIEFIRADIRDANAVRRALDGVDLVAHLAAEVGVGQSMYEIERYVGANELGTAVLLQALIRRPVERIVVASSMSIYGEGAYATPDGELVFNARRSSDDIRAGAWDPADPAGRPLEPAPTPESKPADLSSIYALNKFAQERAVLIFGETYRIPAVALRLFNVFGPGQALSNPYTGVLANFASRLLNREPPLIFEDGRQRRDFVHVDDVARAFRLALENDRASGLAINIGSGNSYTISEVARLLADAMGLSIEPEILNKARAGDIRNCFADTRLAIEALGFAASTRLETALAGLVEWVRQSKAHDRAAQMRRELEERGLVA
ncbi:MAG: NAD-dependent epimerase/dehydratase family protein [Beijerinckiaceae bacterium]